MTPSDPRLAALLAFGLGCAWSSGFLFGLLVVVPRRSERPEWEGRMLATMYLQLERLIYLAGQARDGDRERERLP